MSVFTINDEYFSHSYIKLSLRRGEVISNFNKTYYIQRGGGNQNDKLKKSKVFLA